MQYLATRSSDYKLIDNMEDKSTKRLICPHCSSCLSKKAYATHKRLYYDQASNEWIKKQKLTTDETAFKLKETEESMEACDFEVSDPLYYPGDNA